MGYGSQNFVTGAEFDAWVNKVNQDNAMFKKLSGAAIVLTIAVNGVANVDFSDWGADGIVIDWGDGTIDSNFNHYYKETGTYHIRVFGVTNISEYMFANLDELKSVVVPNGVTSIGVGAFASCTSLSEVTIPESVTTIGERCFFNCDGVTITMNPKTPPSIGDRGNYVGFPIQVIVPYDSLSVYQADSNFAKFNGGTFTLDAYVLASKDRDTVGISGTLSIKTSNWVDKYYSVTLSDLGENDAVFFTPFSKESKAAIEEANVFISAEGSVVSFTCENTPAENIYFKYFICRGA